MSELAKALVQAQAEFPAIERSRKVDTGKYTYSYAPFEDMVKAVRPICTAHGLAFIQLLGNVNGQPALKTMLLHEGGEVIQDSCPLPVNGHQSAQEFGSLVTYFRRYALQSILGIATEEDDDGNAASESHEAYVRQTQEASKPSEVVLHWSKHKGKKLGDLTPRQLEWYANQWKLQDTPSEYDHYVKQAAISLLAGHDEFSTWPDDVPFA